MRRLTNLLLLIALFFGGGFVWLYIDQADKPAVETTTILPEIDKAPVEPEINVQPIRPIIGNIDRIVVEKAARRMTLYQKDQAVRTYEIALGFAPNGDKSIQGDGKTPEGTFKINRRNAQSAYTLSLGIDYPRPADIVRANAGGYDPGGDIFIHGQPNTFKGLAALGGDWTAGCIAVDNAEISEIWGITPIGTVVEIRT